jgi:transcriptional antiterminator RfaH
MYGIDWVVAHTKPRCEKKLVQYCEREGIDSTLPCYRSPHRYRGKTVVFLKPLFPGYVFLRLSTDQRRAIRQSDHIANLLIVTDQELFDRQLREIMAALQTDVEVRLAPAIGEGVRVQIKSGPLRGLEGWVENRQGPTTVMLRLDFIGQAAAVKVEAWELEPT